MLDADGHELREVARGEQDREAALVDRHRIHVADAHAEHLHAVLVGVQAGERLAEHLGHAVAAVGLRVDAVVDGLIAAIEARCMVRGRKQDALDAVPARRLKYVVAADDVGVEDALPGSFHRIAAQVHDRIDTLRDAQGVGKFRNIRANELFFFVQFLQRTKI